MKLLSLAISMAICATETAAPKSLDSQLLAPLTVTYTTFGGFPPAPNPNDQTVCHQMWETTISNGLFGSRIYCAPFSTSTPNMTTHRSETQDATLSAPAITSALLSLLGSTEKIPDSISTEMPDDWGFSLNIQSGSLVLRYTNFRHNSSLGPLLNFLLDTIEQENQKRLIIQPLQF